MDGERERGGAGASPFHRPHARPHLHPLPSPLSLRIRQAKDAEELAAAVAAARATPAGSKKDYATPFPKGYAPQLVEAATYAWWEACGFFAPDAAAKAGTPLSHADDAAGGPPDAPFTMVIPPPNVTGSLHLGHALMAAIEDAVVRWHRMCGRRTLWVPGTDHAGIATQTVVEKQLAREKGLTRHDLGREAFVDAVHAWVDKYGNTICSQLRRLGASPDWSRQAFTMDARCSAAVQEAFTRLHARGLVYRDHRLVNWSTRLKTAISDIEVEHVDVPAFHKLKVPGYDKPVEFGVLTSFAYPLEGGEDGAAGGCVAEIVVATTRPETMLGDTAIAVHPDDPRYTALVGGHALHPLSGRRIPIIADGELVDMAFGTGAVKITPAHDPNDFATGKRHGLEFMSVFDDEGNVTPAAGGDRFGGLPRFAARVAVVDWLKEAGLFRGVAGNPMRLGLCSRSGDVVEPVLKPQWWVSCAGMAAKAGDAVRTGAIRVVPPEAEATWHRWLDNIRDWCVSRQLWWGHRIPAWYVRCDADAPGAVGPPGSPTEDTGRWVVAPDEPAALAAAAALLRDAPPASLTVTQDEDVLDTWFSSGLFPFAVFGWPEATPDLASHYPTSLLETGHDILFFWVARMAMLGLELMDGVAPFHTVYLHTMVRDAHGRKMSKSLGNVVDPLAVIEGIGLDELHATLEAANLDPREVEIAKKGQAADFPDGIEECGADALRLALVSYTTQARDINLDIHRVVTYRHWCNKLWNAVRFAVLNLGGGEGEGEAPFTPDTASLAPGATAASLPLACRWILSRLDAAAGSASKCFAAYEFADGAQALYVFWQAEVCDVFIELVKPAVAAGGDPAIAAAFRQTLWAALDAGLRLLHPLMPFVTEELWQRLPRGGAAPIPASIMVAPYPTPCGWADTGAEAGMGSVLAAAQAARSLRAGYGLLPKQQPPLYVLPADAGAGAPFDADARGALATLACASAVEVVAPGAPPPAGCGVAVVDDRLSVAIALAGVLDPAKELAKLATRAAAVAATAAKLKAAQCTASYAAKTPADVQEADADKLAKAEAEAAVIAGHIADMERLSLG